MGRIRSAENFVRTINMKSPLNTPEQALGLMKIIDATYASAKKPDACANRLMQTWSPQPKTPSKFRKIMARPVTLTGQWADLSIDELAQGQGHGLRWSRTRLLGRPLRRRQGPEDDSYVVKSGSFLMITACNASLSQIT